MLNVRQNGNSVDFGDHFSVTFYRTLRIPDDGRTYPLPPGLGSFPIRKVEDYPDRVPSAWKERGGVFIPMYQREAMWLGFGGAFARPCAVKIAVGKINAVTGDPLTLGLNASKQDYLVCPEQPWLDGINAGNGFIRQFVAMPLGIGYTVEGQVSGKEESGGIQIIVFAPKPEKFPDRPPQPERYPGEMMMGCGIGAPGGGTDMGLGAGGKMEQKIYPDRHGIDAWDLTSFGRLYVHIANSMMYREITGQEPPPTPITVRTYTDSGLPWFGLYDEDKGDVTPSEILTQVKSIKDMDQGKGFGPQQDDTPVAVPARQIKKLKTDPHIIPDGNW